MHLIPDEVRGISYVVPLTWEGKTIGKATVNVAKEEPLAGAGRYVGPPTTEVAIEISVTNPEFEARMAKHVMSSISISIEEAGSDAGS